MALQLAKADITTMAVDAIVNAANRDLKNDALRRGGGVCGAIFRAAGHQEMQAACDAIGHCDTGSAVITPGFLLKARHIIHAVGPVWHGGNHGEAKLLYGAYQSSLQLALDNGCRSIGFPLISAGIFGYPKDKAWKVAIQACQDFFQKNPDADLEVVFAVLDDHILTLGQQTLKESGREG